MAAGGGSSTVQRCVREALHVCDVPMRAGADGRGGANPGLIELDTALLARWVRWAIGSGLLRGYFAADDRFLIRLDDEQAQRVELAARGTTSS